MFKLLKEVFRTGNATVKYPFVPLTVSPNFRGKPQYDPERCIACGACTIACPANALSMTTDIAAGNRTWEICFGRCVFCGRCEEVCPTQAIVLSPEFELAVMDRADLYQTAEFRLFSCRVCGTPFAPKKEIDYLVSLLKQSGLSERDAEKRGAEFETCPACKRLDTAVKEAGLGSLLQDEDAPFIREVDFGTPPSKEERQVTLTIDGVAVSVPEGTSILRAAMEAGIEIPRLCATEAERPFGSCRLCLIEIEGRAGTPASCTTPVADGLVVKTQTERLKQIRRGVMELYISDHPLDCRNCFANGDCELQDTALAVDLHDTRFGFDGVNHLRDKKDESNPYFTFTPAKCIVCSRCIRACDEIQGTFALTLTGRGFKSRVAAGMDETFLESDCESCGACIEACPTATLMEKSVIADGQPLHSVVTTCTYCGVGCSFKAEMRNDELVRMIPSMNGQSNRGHSCVTGRFAWGYATHKDRVLKPMIREKISDPWREVSWEEAIGRAASEFRRIRERHGRGAIGGITSPRCTNEETFLVHTLVSTASGIDGIDARSRLSRLSTGDGHDTAFSALTGIQDFDSVEQADVIMVVGANLSDSHPVFASRLKRRLREGAKLIVVDPLRTDFVRTPHVEATHHLALRPGTNVAVLTALAHVIVEEGLINEAFVLEHCDDFAAWAAFVRDERHSSEEVEKISGVPAGTIRAAARLYATGGNGAIYYGRGVTERNQGATAVAAIVNLAMATGNIGRPGGGVNLLRGQNNALVSSGGVRFPHELQGRGEAADDATRADPDSTLRAALDVWPELRISPLLVPALEGLFKGLYIQGEEIVQSDPDMHHIASRLAAMECVVVHGLFLNETAKYAHVFLPGSAFLEEDGTFMNAERRISRVRKVIAPKNGYTDWEITLKLARAVGYPKKYANPSEIMDEMARTMPSFAGVSYDKLETLGSVPWPCSAPSGPDAGEGGKGGFAITEYVPTDEKTNSRFPLLLNTGRSRQMPRTGNIVGGDRDLLEIHPRDANERGIRDGDLVCLSSRTGATNLRARITERVAPGTVRATFQRPETQMNVVATEYFDWLTNNPEYKIMAVQVQRAEAAE